MCPQKVVPAVVVDRVRSLAVNRDVHGLVALHKMACLRIKFDDADEAEISPVRYPQPAVRGIEQKAGINGIVVLNAVRRGNDVVVIPRVVGGIGVERLAPLHTNCAGVASSQTAAGRGVSHIVTITDVNQVWGRPGLNPGPTMPDPAVFGDQPGSARAPSVVLAIALQDSRGIVNVRLAVQGQRRT